MIYLDNAATTRMCPEALDAYNEAASREGNPSSFHESGRAVRALLDRSRETVASALDCPPGCIVFTSGGTESINTALRGVAVTSGRRKKHIVTTALEHSATLRTISALQSEGFRVTEVAPGKDGRLSPDSLAAAVTDDTCLVAAVLVSSETGALLDTRAVTKAVKARNPETAVHIDAVQGFLKTPISAVEWGADLISLSGHKIHGPMGIGALFAAPSARISPLLTGGAQESGRRAGTEPVPLIAAFSAAISAWRAVPSLLMQTAVAALAAIEDCVILPPHDAPHILSAAFPGAPGEVLVRILSDAGIAIGSGSACSGGHRSHALTAMRLPVQILDSVVRLSFSSYNSVGDITSATDALAAAAARIRGAKR